MKINNLNRITFWVLATGLLVSCNDNDFLREKTESSYTYVNAFNVSSQVPRCPPPPCREWALRYGCRWQPGSKQYHPQD